MGITPLTNKYHIYKAFESFATQNGNILATIKYSQKFKSYQTSSPIALLLLLATKRTTCYAGGKGKALARREVTK